MWEERKIAQRIAIFNHPTATISFFTLYFFPPLLVLERIIISCASRLLVFLNFLFARRFWKETRLLNCYSRTSVCRKIKIGIRDVSVKIAQGRIKPRLDREITLDRSFELGELAGETGSEIRRMASKRANGTFSCNGCFHSHLRMNRDRGSWFERVIFSLATNGRRGVILFSFSAAKLSSKAKLVFDDASPIRSLTRGDKRPKERTGLAFVPSFNRAIYSHDRAKYLRRLRRGLLRYFPRGRADIPFVQHAAAHYRSIISAPVSSYSNHGGHNIGDISPPDRGGGFPRKIRFAFISRYAGTRWNLCRRGRYLVEGRTNSGYSRLVKTSKAGISSIFDRTFS